MTIINFDARSSRGATAVIDLLCGRTSVTPSDGSSYTDEYDKVEAAGGTVVYYDDSDALYIHAKAVVADYGTSSAKVFLGSQNFTSTSLNSNRELGLIITDAAVISSVNATLATDFAGGTAY